MTDLFTPAARSDPEMDQVEAQLRRLDPSGERWAAVVRHTYDVIYNGAETGRYRWDQLMKTEKTHFGTLFEINAQREFKFEGGADLDYTIAGIDVDAKWSQDIGRWMLPPEVFDKIALVATGRDSDSCWSLGLVRVLPEYRSEKTNRDKKSTLNSAGRGAVRWIWRNAQMPSNVLLQLPREVVDEIFESKFGTKRVDRLFRAAEGRLVHRNIVRTVAMQLDDQKRVRYNGGARSSLREEGYLILSGKYHAHLAIELGLPVPNQLQYVSSRVVPSGDSVGTIIAGRRWSQMLTTGFVNERAPKLPERGVRE
jgi:hypothetical protein